MFPGIWIAVYLAEGQQARARRQAAEWRRLHTRPDAPPLAKRAARIGIADRVAAIMVDARRRLAR